MRSCDKRILMMTCLLLYMLLFQTWLHPLIPSRHLMEAFATIQGGMSTMQQSISSLQLEVRSINKRVEQTHLDLQECLRVHHPDSSDDEDAAAQTVHMLEDV